MKIELTHGGVATLMIQGLKFPFQIDNSITDNIFMYAGNRFEYEWYMGVILPCIKANQNLRATHDFFVCNLDMFYKFKEDVLPYVQSTHIESPA